MNSEKYIGLDVHQATIVVPGGTPGMAPLLVPELEGPPAQERLGAPRGQKFAARFAFGLYQHRAKIPRITSGLKRGSLCQESCSASFAG
jgi:hypothetical protein